MGLGPTHPTAGLPFFCHNGDPLSQPPPAHMGIPPYQLDGKTGSMGEYGRAPLSPADWRRLGPLLAATGTQKTNAPSSWVSSIVRETAEIVVMVVEGSRRHAWILYASVYVCVCVYGNVLFEREIWGNSYTLLQSLYVFRLGAPRHYK